MKLKNILLEIINFYSAECIVVIDDQTNISSTLNKIRAIKNVVTIRVVDDIERDRFHSKVRIKFLSSTDPLSDIEKIKSDILTSDEDLKIKGVLNFKIFPNSITKI